MMQVIRYGCGKINISILNIVSTYKKVNGNDGKSTGVAYSQPGGVTTSTYKWGEGHWLSTTGAVQAGGVRLVYKRLQN